MDKDKVIEDIIETEEVVETHHNSQSRDFGWESLASVEQSRQNEIISEIDRELSSKSKYFSTWEKYKENHPEVARWPEAEDVIASKIQKYEDLMFNFIINKCS